MAKPSTSQPSKHKARTVCLAKDAAAYFSSLDATLRRRIKDKLAELALDPFDIRTSKPLRGSDKRTARVGSYRILFLVDETKAAIVVAAIGPRGQIYRDA